jgi:hypothetical protein
VHVQVQVQVWNYRYHLIDDIWTDLPWMERNFVRGVFSTLMIVVLRH